MLAAPVICTGAIKKEAAFSDGLSMWITDSLFLWLSTNRLSTALGRRCIGDKVEIGYVVHYLDDPRGIGVAS